MTQFRRKSNVIEAVRWFKNGDHPNDYYDNPKGEEHGWEGGIVRYFRNPDVPGESICEACGVQMHDHGWIDTGGVGYTVCPGDYVVTEGDRSYPLKPQDFHTIFEQDGTPYKKTPATTRVSLIHHDKMMFPFVINEETGERIKWITNLNYNVSGDGFLELEIRTVPKRILLRSVPANVVEDEDAAAEFDRLVAESESEPEVVN